MSSMQSWVAEDFGEETSEWLDEKDYELRQVHRRIRIALAPQILVGSAEVSVETELKGFELFDGEWVRRIEITGLSHRKAERVAEIVEKGNYNLAVHQAKDASGRWAVEVL